MKSRLILFGILFIMLFGCTAPADAPQAGTGVGAGASGPEVSPNETNVSVQETAGTETSDDLTANDNEPAQAGLSFEEYENIGIAFEYPEGSKIDEALSSYPGYAVVAIKDDQSKSWVLLSFMNMSSTSSLLEGTSEELAEGFMEAQSKDDNMGILHQATSKGSITPYTSPNGFSMAERTFSVVVSGQSVEGHAIEIYDADKNARYSVRIFAEDGEVAKELKERFVSTFRYTE